MQIPRLRRAQIESKREMGRFAHAQIADKQIAVMLTQRKKAVAEPGHPLYRPVPFPLLIKPRAAIVGAELQRALRRKQRPVAFIVTLRRDRHHAPDQRIKGGRGNQQPRIASHLPCDLRRNLMRRDALRRHAPEQIKRADRQPDAAPARLATPQGGNQTDY